MPNGLKSPPPDLRVAVAGLGAIGQKIARALDQGIDGMVLAAVAAKDPITM